MPYAECKRKANRSSHPLMQVKASQARKEPYVIVFVGVNGVGKSTSLSKVCFKKRERK